MSAVRSQWWASLTGDGLLQVSDRHFGNKPVDLPIDVLLGKPPKMLRDVQSVRPALPALAMQSLDINEAALRVLSHPAVADKTFLITIGDRTVGGQISRDQMVGPWQVPVADVAVTLSDYCGHTGEAMAMGERTPLALLDSAAAARVAVAEAITNILAADIAQLGDIRLSANWMAACGEPGEDAALYDAVKAVGMELCPALGIAIPVGKDSLSMKTQWRDGAAQKSVVAPVSLIVSAFAPVDDVRRTLTPQLRMDAGATRLLLGGPGPRQVPAGRFHPCAGIWTAGQRAARPGLRRNCCIGFAAACAPRVRGPRAGISRHFRRRVARHAG